MFPEPVSLLLLGKNFEITFTRDRGASLGILKNNKIDAVWIFILVLLGRTWLKDHNAALDQAKFGGGWVRSMKGNSKEHFSQGVKKVSFTPCHSGKL